MKSKVRLFIVAGIILAVILTGICFVVSLTKAPVIAFYGLPEREVAAIQTVIGDNVTYLSFGTDTSLYYQVRNGKKPDVIITPSGVKLQAAKAHVAKNVSLPESLFDGMTSSIRNTIQKTDAGKIVTAPLLSSHFEIDIQMDLFRQSDVKTIATWQDIEAFVKTTNHTKNARMAFAGKDPDTFFDLLGALAEALSGKNSYGAAVNLVKAEMEDNALRERAFNANALAEQLATQADSPLYDAIACLRRWYKEDLINKESFSMDRDALVGYMRAQLASVVFMSLSDYRSIAYDVVSSYTSIYFPSEIIASGRSFTAPVIHAVCLTKNRKAAKIIAQLTASEAQAALTRASGLAPVLANCPTPDRQAEDARYWVAATNTPLAGLSQDIDLSADQKKALAIALSTLIQR